MSCRQRRGGEKAGYPEGIIIVNILEKLGINKGLVADLGSRCDYHLSLYHRHHQSFGSAAGVAGHAGSKHRRVKRDVCA